MNFSAFKPFFSFVEPSWSPKVTYGLTHFYNRARSNIDWNGFSLIKPAAKGCGEVLLGQIPIQPFRNTLVKKLSGNGLVVSCNDHFELAGIGAFCNIIPPHSWTYYSVDHQHLPFTDYASNADPSLIILTLQKMVHVHNKGGAIYLHCKAGRSRSALIAALFLCITDEAKINQLSQVETVLQIEDILTKTIAELKVARAQVSVGKAKLALGVNVLCQYIQYWHGVLSPDLFNSLTHAENNLCAYQALNIISQSDEYKFVWDQAYKNPYIFPTVKNFAEAMYQYIEKNPAQQVNIDPFIKRVLKSMKEGELQIIVNLHDTYVAKEQFINQIKHYPFAIQDLGLDLLDKVLKSELSYPEKTAWLTKTNAYLSNPDAQCFAQYKAEAQLAFNRPSHTLSAIGSSMMVLGVAVIAAAIVAGFLATGSFWVLAWGCIGTAAFGAFQLAIGKLIYEQGKSNKIAIASHMLISTISEIDDKLDKEYKTAIF